MEVFQKLSFVEEEVFQEMERNEIRRTESIVTRFFYTLKETIFKSVFRIPRIELATHE